MPLNAFIVRPFGIKELQVSSADVHARLDAASKSSGTPRVVDSIKRIGEGDLWTARISFDAIDRALIQPALQELNIKGETTEAVVKAGNIREDMFNRLVTADVVIADLTVYNPNVYYELGVRQAFRDKYTFLVRSDLSNYPFDLQTDRYFAYDVVELANDPGPAVRRLVAALRATLNSPDADSPIFKLLPQLEAEDRARFITVPEDFREEVEWARHQLRSEHLSLMAVECDGYLWEVEGLRVIGRAQFECNFIDAARCTWEQIVGRYPDDVEGNSVLSTIYQRLSDMKKSEQALSRVARTRSLTPTRMSQVRSLSGRNLKAAWTERWRRSGEGPKEWQRAALLSPLLQRAFEAFHEAFKLDLNNSYAGLNALTMLVIQTELAERFPEEWASIQQRPLEAERELSWRKARIAQLVAALQLAVESDRERLQHQGQVDPWFQLLDAAVACLLSNQPAYVAQLYEQAVHFAPESAEASIRGSLQVYKDLAITGRTRDNDGALGCVDANVARALAVLARPQDATSPSRQRRRILMFVGLRADSTSRRGRFPPESVEGARQAIETAIDDEIRKAGRQAIAFGIAAGASGGDLQFHEICRTKLIPTRMCLALRKPQYVGQYVAPAGREWVEKFSEIYRYIDEQQEPAHGAPGESRKHGLRNDFRIHVFTEFSDLPRWLQGKPLYNVGRRNNHWMLQHAIAAAHELGPDTEITLLALWDENPSQEFGEGGISDLTRKAAMQGIKVVSIRIPRSPAHETSEAPGSAGDAAPRAAAPVLAKVAAEHDASESAPSDRGPGARLRTIPS
jgi:hypothetical protein